MSVKIRLRRIGAKKRPFYRIVVADSRTARDGRIIEAIGYYDPLTDPPTMKIDDERAKLWLGRGAQPTDTAGALLKKLGLIGAPKIEEVKEEEPKVEKKTTRKKAEEVTAVVEEAPKPAKARTTKPKKEKTEAVAEAPAETTETASETAEEA